MSIVMSESTRTAWKKHEGRCLGAYFFFTVCEIHFSGFIKALDSKGILCTLKEVLRQPHNVQVAGFTFATRQIISCLLCKFISPEVLVINLFAHLRIFLVE